MPASKYIMMDGELVPSAEAKIHVYTPAVRFGAHVFEGIRAYWNNEHEELYVFRLREHLERLRQGMKIMRYDTVATVEEMTDQVLETIRANEYRGDVGIRLSAYVAGEGFIDATGPVSLMVGVEPGAAKSLADKASRGSVSSWRRIDDNAMPPRLKCAANYQNSRLGLLDVRNDGHDEPIFLTQEGKVAEGAGACLMMVRDGQPITSPITAGILESVTRDTMFWMFEEHFGKPVEERAVDRTELYVADELFLCGSAYEVMPLTTVDGLPVGDGEVGEITTKVWQTYDGVVRGTLPDHPAWRTPVYGGQPEVRAAE